MYKFFMEQFKKSKARGAALILTIFFFVVISVAIIQSATIGAISELRTYRSLVTSKNSYIAAEAGIEDLYYRTISNKQLPVSNSETLTLNNAISTVTINPVSSSEKEFYSVGDASTRIRKLYMKTSKTASPIFFYGAQVGRGGIVMKNNAHIVATNLGEGNVYSNGAISGNNGAYITGSATVASGITPDITASSTECDKQLVVGQKNGISMYAQSFVMSSTSPDTLAKVSLLLARTGAPTGATVYIMTDNAGKPSSTAIASQALNYNLVGTSPSMVDVIFTSSPTLQPNTKYWIVLRATGNNATKYWLWCFSLEMSGPESYPDGQAQSNQGTTWPPTTSWIPVEPVGADMGFKIYLGGGQSLINGVVISGMAKADVITASSVGGDGYYQTINGGTTIAGTAYPGSPTPPELSLPIPPSTIDSWEVEAELGGVINGNCGTGGVAGCNTFPLTLGPKLIKGNLVLGDGQVLTVSGTLHVKGYLSVSNNGTIACATSYLANSCKIIVDGYADINNNGVFRGSGTAGSYVFVLSQVSNCLASGTQHAGCAPNDSGINLENNVDGALFYTTNSAIYISNNATVKAVVGYKIVLDNNATIAYDSLVRNLTLASDGSSGSGSIWYVNRWDEY